MTFWKRALGLGVVMWLVPFMVASAVFPLREAQRPLFESIMAVTVAATAVALGLAYLKGIDTDFAMEAGRVGILWLLISVAIDAPLMLLGGPMQMTLAQYTADIGVTYVTIPVVVWGLGVARSWS